MSVGGPRHPFIFLPVSKPVTQASPKPWLPDWLTVGLVWFLTALNDGVWLILDQGVPAWDQADYLTGALNYWHTLQTPDWFSGTWWTELWLMSPKVPPLTYLSTAPLLSILGQGPDQTTAINILWSGILFAAVYGLGRRLFNRQVGLWAVILSALVPGLYRFRVQFLLDYPLITIVTLCFYCLTEWWKTTPSLIEPQTGKFRQFLLGTLWAIIFGVCFGFAILVKQTALFFLLIPLLWVGIDSLRHRWWGRVFQLFLSSVISLCIFGPWASTNWLLMITAGKRATIDSAIAEGDPPLNTLAAWTYYAEKLPSHLSWPLLIIPVLGFLVYFIDHAIRRRLSSSSETTEVFPQSHLIALRWLTIFLCGAYLLWSLNLNKDFRYSLPTLPILLVILGYGFTLWPRWWGAGVRWATVGLSGVILLGNLWPVAGLIGEDFTAQLSPEGKRVAYLGEPWPHEQVIAEITQATPYVQTTLGVLPSTPEINQHNLNYYGALENFQVYGRQVGTRLDDVPQDLASLSWFITKTGDQGSIRERIRKAQETMVSTLATSDQFELYRIWQLPDQTYLNLHRRRVPWVEVTPLPNSLPQVELTQVQVPAKVPPGQPIPVTYTWSGAWQELQPGLIILTWKQVSPLPTNFIQSADAIDYWLHDHGMGLSFVHSGLRSIPEDEQGFQVIERLAMFPPGTVTPGTYTLEATYYNRNTGETYPVKVPAVQITLDPQSPPLPAPELDWVTQLRELAQGLPQGIPGLEPIFNQIGRINQYDPTQDYTQQAELSLAYRLQQDPNHPDWAYTLALARVLQQNAEGAIEALQGVTQLDPENPYAYAYLAFVHLYQWQGKPAETALESALALAPERPELRALHGVAALMQGKLWQAWQDLQALRELEI